MQKLILRGEDVNRPLNDELTTPLHLAVRNACETIVMILLKQQVLVNSQDIHGMTAMHHLALQASENTISNYFEVYSRILESLVNFGARFDVRAKDGSTPQDIAREQKNSRVISMFESVRK